MTRPLREALISPSAISGNVEALRRLTPTTHAMVVVKADGYGHGALTVSRAALAAGATWLGTADITEALELRAGGIQAPILAWIFGPTEDPSVAIQQGIDLGVSSIAQLEQVAQAAAGAPARVHLKIDTGLSRAGASMSQWPQLCEAAKGYQDSGAIEVIGIYTHLSGASREADAAQGVEFDLAVDAAHAAGLTPEIRHVAASSAAASSPGLAHDMIRLGIAAYGIPQVPAHEDIGLRPAMRLAGQVVLVKRVPAGRGVGYGHTYMTRSETTLALVPIGYADGAPRQASNRGPVVIGGERYTVSGRISMDQFSVDVGEATPREGDWAILFGDPSQGEPGVAEWADAAGTIGYDIVTGLGRRIVRVVGQ